MSDRLKASGQTFENSKQKAAGAVVKFNEAKQRRCVLFDPPFACLPYPALPYPTSPARILAVTLPPLGSGAAAPRWVWESAWRREGFFLLFGPADVMLSVGKPS